MWHHRLLVSEASEFILCFCGWDQTQFLTVVPGTAQNDLESIDLEDSHLNLWVIFDWEVGDAVPGSASAWLLFHFPYLQEGFVSQTRAWLWSQTESHLPPQLSSLTSWNIESLMYSTTILWSHWHHFHEFCCACLSNNHQSWACWLLTHRRKGRYGQWTITWDWATLPKSCMQFFANYMRPQGGTRVYSLGRLKKLGCSSSVQHGHPCRVQTFYPPTPLPIAPHPLLSK